MRRLLLGRPAAMRCEPSLLPPDYYDAIEPEPHEDEARDEQESEEAQ